MNWSPVVVLATSQRHLGANRGIACALRATSVLALVIASVGLTAGCRSKVDKRSAQRATAGLALPTATGFGGDAAANQVARAHHSDDFDEYVAMLERPERAIWQKPREVVAALELKGNETVVDIGAGTGYFTFELARALPKGKVIAEDSDPRMIQLILTRTIQIAKEDSDKPLGDQHPLNLETLLIKPDVPVVSTKADWVFVCDVLHHVPEPTAWLGRIADSMRRGARLALIEFKEGPLPQGPPESRKIPRARLQSLLKESGLVLEREPHDLLPYQVFFVYRKP